MPLPANSLQPRLRARIPGAALLGSLVLHAGLLGLGIVTAMSAWKEPLAVAIPAETPRDVEHIEVPVMTTGEGEAPLPPQHVAEEVRPQGGAVIPRVDTGTAGHGGDLTASEDAEHLADRDERLHYAPDLQDRLDRSQAQRLNTARERQAWEDRRAARQPTELSFLATGPFEKPTRDKLAASPTLGARQSFAASALGGVVGAAPSQPEDEGAHVPAGAAHEGSDRERPGLGDAHGRVSDASREGTRIATGRPAVAEGNPSIPAEARGKPQDRVDSDQAVATMLRALVHESPAGGAPGVGVGGSGGGGAAGADGRDGAGSHPVPLGPGGGTEWFDLDSRDPNLLPYFRKLHGKIDPRIAKAFPREATVDLKQGYVILQFVVSRDGSVRVVWPPYRPSGIDAYDNNCKEAVLASAPFDPIPASLGRNELKIRATFRANRQW